MATVTLTGKVMLPTGDAAVGTLEIKAVSGEKTDGTVFAGTPVIVSIGGDGSVSLTLEEGLVFDVVLVTTGNHPRRYSLGQWVVPASGAFSTPTLFDAMRSALGGTNGSLLSKDILTSGLVKSPKRGSSDIWTFTPRMGVRPNGLSSPLGYSYIVQGKSDIELANLGDILTFGRGNQIDGNHYETFNSNQGTLIAIVQVPWLGSEAKSRYLFGQNNGLMIAKYGAGKTIAVNTLAATRVQASCDAWTRGSWHSIICRWNSINPVSGTSTSDLWLDGVQTLGGTATWTAPVPASLSSIGAYEDKRYPWGGSGIAALVLTDNVISDAECTAIHNGGAFVDPSRVLLSPERIVAYVVPGKKYSAAAAITGTLTDEACNVDQKVFVASTNENGNKIVNPGFEATLGAEWVAENSTLSRATSSADMVGMFDGACLKITSTTDFAAAAAAQTVVVAGNENFFISITVRRGTSDNISLQIFSGPVGDPYRDTLTVITTPYDNGVYHITTCVRVAADAERLRISCVLGGVPFVGMTGFADNVSVYKILVNGSFSGTYSGGLAPGWTASGATPTENLFGGRDALQCQHVVSTVANGGILSTSFTTVIGRYYLVSGWVKQLSGGAVYLGLNSQNSDSTTASGVWTHLSTIFKATATSHQIMSYAAINTTWDVDDVTVVELDSISLTATASDETGSKDVDGFRIDGADICSKPTFNDIAAAKGTILIKFKPRNWNGDDSRYHYLMDIRSSDTLRLLMFTYKSGTCYAVGAIYDATGYKAKDVVINASILPADTIATMGFRWNNGTLKVQCNGVDDSISGGSGTGVLSGIPTPMYLGCCATSSDNTADSEILAVKTFDRDLTDAELTAELAAL